MTFLATVSFLLAQAEGAGGGGGQTPPSGGMGGMTFLIPAIGIMVVFMWMSSRSQKKKEKERQLMIDNVKPRDRVVTIGGIHGRVVSVKDNKLTLCIDENKDVRITVNRSAISRPLKDGDDGDEDEQAA